MTYTVTTGEYPPCVKHAIDMLEKGENLPHSGRFMLATFLLSKGQSIQQIAPLFKNAPDYNERVTLYQPIIWQEPQAVVHSTHVLHAKN